MSMCNQCGESFEESSIVKRIKKLCLRCRKAKAQILRNKSKVKKYKLSYLEFLELKSMQNKRCAVCDKEEFLVIDHDHETGEVRGLICRGCNTKLSKIDAFIKDGSIYKLLKYLKI